MKLDSNLYTGHIRLILFDLKTAGLEGFDELSDFILKTEEIRFNVPIALYEAEDGDILTAETPGSGNHGLDLSQSIREAAAILISVIQLISLNVLVDRLYSLIEYPTYHTLSLTRYGDYFERTEVISLAIFMITLTFKISILMRLIFPNSKTAEKSKRNQHSPQETQLAQETTRDSSGPQPHKKTQNPSGQKTQGRQTESFDSSSHHSQDSL